MDKTSEKTGKELPGSFCQSCGMPLEDANDFGTNFDSTKNPKYCRFCFLKGRFTEPDITMEEMVEKIVGIMKLSKAMPEKEVREKALFFLKTLDRWRV